MKAFFTLTLMFFLATNTKQVFAQKIITPGDNSASSLIEEEMARYSQQTTDEAKKALYASFAKPQERRSYSVKFFKKIYEEQLRKMFCVINGEIVQVQKWQIKASYEGATPRVQLVTISSTRENIPYLHRVQIRKSLGDFIYMTRLDDDYQNTIVKFPNAKEEYNPGTILEANLLRKQTTAELRNHIRKDPEYSNIYVSVYYECVPDDRAVGRPPTTREIIKAMRGGLRPVVQIVTEEVKCSRCSAVENEHNSNTAVRRSYCSKCNGTGKIEKKEFIKLAK